jgi:hypothetical protein
MVHAILELMPAIAGRSFHDDSTGLAVLTGAAAVTFALKAGGNSAVRLLTAVLMLWRLGAVGAIVLIRVWKARCSPLC